MDIYGKLHQRNHPVELYRKDGTAVTNRDGIMSKMSFVIKKKTSGKTEKFVELQTFDRKVMEFVTDTPIGTSLRIRFDIESREWGGKWFTSVTALEVEYHKTKDNDDVYRHSSRIGKEDAVDALYGSPVKDEYQTPSYDEPGDLPF